MTGAVRRGIRGYKRYKKRVRIMKFLALFVICIVVALGVKKTVAYYGGARIDLTVNEAELLQGEKMPELTATVTMDGNEKCVLNKEEKYTIQELVDDLKAGKGYTIQTDADADVEGDYTAEIKLDKDFQKKLDEEWNGSVDLELVSGSVHVKNPVGDWDGTKFKRYDGSYVKEEFVKSLGKKYYFDANGEMVTGLQVIGDSTYFFDEEGKMQTKCWQKVENDRYYFGKNGKAVSGWNTIKKNEYFFHQDGKLATGDVYIGMALYTFDDDGKFVSKKKIDVDPDKPMVALTFDDGPGARTGELLEALEKHDAHATFFMVGTNIPRYKDEIKKMKKIGCELGNHSLDHADLSKLDAKGVKKEVNTTNELLEDIVDSGATVLRPPYGAISQTLKKHAGLPLILWNIDTLDWKTRNAEKTIETVMENVKDGDIILMHDIHTESVDAAIELIPMLEEEGYQLVTVSEMAAAKGIKMEKGGKYTDF